ncbi:uncharacterized protein TNIN_175801 [Trichonephila inaurata madagascariensis]|uniref:SP-RING-type domain-containing protein n=1 Tax=Trichonephila inaurata madagascariensis TaxID=2747483 RepID=A0A8X6X6J6_9ARAC|nr:uncharacterized protein TNIN_175801 [Trichonephila inaurata madagascariensis]
MRIRAKYADYTIDTNDFPMFQEQDIIIPGQKFQLREEKQIIEFALPSHLINKLIAGKQPDGSFRHEIQFRVWDCKNNEEWPDIHLCIEVNEHPVFVPQPSPHIVYITAYCALEETFCNQVIISSPRSEVLESYAFDFSLVTRYFPSEIIQKNPLKITFNTKELAEGVLKENEDRHLVIFMIDNVTQKVIKEPCRSSICEHPEIFDLETFLKDAQYKLQWKCPICLKKIKYTDLVIDMFLKQMSNQGKTTFHFYKPRNSTKLLDKNDAGITCEREVIQLD